MSELPRFNQDELIPLLDLRRQYPREFNSNKTAYFYREMARYIIEKRVWRISLMGETRGGKSEIGSTLAFTYLNIFNYYFDLGHFKKMDFKKGEILIQEIKFGTDYVYDNQMVYKNRQKERIASHTLVYGQIHQIDEHKTSIGGIGSFSETIETNNINNISAKYNQSEIWIEPDQLQTMNCPFGLEVKKKDTVNKVNWCLLWKIEAQPTGGVQFKFLGWAKIPLHHNEVFRKEYNLLKNIWIGKEMSGRLDERAYKRTEASLFLLKKYPDFFTANDKGKWKYSSGKILELVQIAMENGEVDSNFNRVEQEAIVNKCFILREHPELLKNHKKG